MGFGNMGKAIAKTLEKNDKSIKIFAIDVNKKNTIGIKKSDFIIIAVKPQDATSALLELKTHGLNKNTILISIMAGFSIGKLTKISGHKKVIRLMPNMGLSIGLGIAGWKKVGLSAEESKKAKNFIDKITENFEVKDEDTIDKVTAISGSGPAYFFLLADCILNAGKSLGLTEGESRKLVEKTFLASAILAKDEAYDSLIKKIASKGGTTEKALEVFKKENLDKIVLKAVTSAYKRAKELSHQ
jgi:pyrroline-5-carboxylate reductase